MNARLTEPGAPPRGVARKWRALPSARRSVFSSLNLLATAALIGVLFIMVNFVASRRYARWDWTRARITDMSDQTRQTLLGLREPVSAIVFYQPSHRLYELVGDLLREYARVNPKLDVEFVDPEQDLARAQQLVGEFQIDVNSAEALNLVIFKSGDRHKYLSDTDLADYDTSTAGLGGEPRVKTFKGEAAFTAAIHGVTQDEQPLLWSTTGHGEKALDSEETQGLTGLRQTLEQQNMKVETVTLLERTEIPAEVKLLLIAGPTHQFAEQELALLEAYVQRGGRLLALIDPLADANLSTLLRRWGIALGADIVVDPERQLPFVSAANLFVTDYTEHPIVRKMKTLMTLFPLARSVRPHEPPPQGVTVEPLAVTSDKGWGETQTSNQQFQFNDGEDLPGPVSIAVAAERGASAEPPAPATRMVVIGDSEFVVNAQLTNVGNRDFFLGALYWLTEQEQRIGIGPKPVESIKLNLTSGQLTGLFWLSFLTMPLCCGLVGAAVWWRRRQ